MEKNVNKSNSYIDIIELSHHVSTSHPHMAVIDRAAQFAPFAALTGHEAAIKETARLTSQRIELDENHKEILNEKLLLVIEKGGERPVLSITFFEADSKKSGGFYVTVEGIVKKIDEYDGVLILLDGTKIALDDIIEINERKI